MTPRSLLHPVCVCLVLPTMVTCTVLSRLFTVRQSSSVPAHKHVLSRASAPACVMECLMHSSSCNATAYRSATKECFWPVDGWRAGSSGSAGDDVAVYVVDFSSSCEQKDAVNSSTTRVVWKASGLRGDLVCLQDYMYSGRNASISCSAQGQWSWDGTCRQKIWRNPPPTMVTFNFPVLPIPDGWAMCVKGVACTSCARFSFNLMKSETSHLCHMDVRFDYHNEKKIVRMASAENGQFSNHLVTTLFPFTWGQPFWVEFRLLSFNKLQVTANGTVLPLFNSPASFADMTFFKISTNNADAVLQFVDLWSGC